MRYLRGTSIACLCFENGKYLLDGFTDAYMVGDLDSRESMLGYVIAFVVRAVPWQSKLQKVFLCRLQRLNILQLQKLAKNFVDEVFT